jgi:hypothetical protein
MPLDSEAIAKLHLTMWQYISSWSRDETGPWWEADLSLDIGCLLKQSFASESSMRVTNLPAFLGGWPGNTRFRRFGSENHFPNPPDRGLYPDFLYRRPDSDECEWILEIKLTALDWAQKRESQAKSFVQSFERDVTKCREQWSKWAAYAMVFFAVTFPAKANHSGRKRYGPEDFRAVVTERLRASPALGIFVNEKRGDLCVVIKTIDTDAREVALVSCLATTRFGDAAPQLHNLNWESLGATG